MDHGDQFSECLLAMKRSHRSATINTMAMKPQEIHKHKTPSETLPREENDTGSKADHGSVIASMVPDEIILQHSNYAVRRYETALMFIDVSGFTDLCERYRKADRRGPSRLTQVLNSYIGAMVQEILSHGGDVLNFSGDAFLSMWKTAPAVSLQCVVHSAIDCGLNIQKNYGSYLTDVGVILKVKVAISAGMSIFVLIGNATHSDFVILGQPVWDVKMAEYVAAAGDVMTTASAWIHANEAKYITEPLADGVHTRVLRTEITWTRVPHSFYHNKEQTMPSVIPAGDIANYYREFSIRPAIVTVLRNSCWESLCKFMVKPVLWAVEHDEPMEFLTEIRRVVIVFLNIITNTVTDDTLIDIVDSAFKRVYSISSASDGLLNKVSMFDKDLMFLLIFGLRAIAHEDDAYKALQCAQTLKESLVDPNIISVSIGITSGTTYCGVVGHVLRREYTVIGSAVNKAARLMMAYPNKLTCDKETFLRSKIDQKFFRLMEFKPMKGIQKPGPVYEFNKYGWPKWQSVYHHPILGRDEELQVFILALQKAMKQQPQTYDRIDDQIYGLVFLGPTSIGKTRLMEECIYLTPYCIQVVRITKSEREKVPYGLFQQIARKKLAVSSLEANEYENKIRNSLDINEMSIVQLYAINVIFGCHFGITDGFYFSGDLLAEHNFIKNLLREVFKHNLSSFWMVAIEDGMSIDDESWKLLLMLLDTKTIFLIICLTDQQDLSDVASQCLLSKMLLKMPLSGLEHSYHSALACQFLDVQAITIDLEKIIQSASNGVPGWILNFIISLVQQGDLSVETERVSKALEKGALVPPSYLVSTTYHLPTVSGISSPVDSTHYNVSQASLDAYFNEVLKTLNEPDNSKVDQNHTTLEQNDFIQVAVLADTYEVWNVNMSMDEKILKTYDSLTPFEKTLLKCSSVLGVVFLRSMMQYLLQCDSPRKVAEAIAKLFSIRVLECEGGDFTRKTSKVLIHPSPEPEGIESQLPYCSCLGAQQLADCADLPNYAFCGYMRFKHPLYRTTTYELLTESQKHEMHSRALFYLEYYTRRCSYCGSGCFQKMMGKRVNDGLVNESEELKNTLQMIRDFASESRDVADVTDTADTMSLVDLPFRSSLRVPISSDKSLRLITGSEAMKKAVPIPKVLHNVRSFSSIDSESCECLAISLFVYRKIINHCRGAGEREKLFEAYLEYAELCIMNSNTPEALQLLKEAENFVLNDDYWSEAKCKIGWLKDFYLGRILSLRGSCMLATGELIEARKHLYGALKLFYNPFPTTKYGKIIRNMRTSMRQWMALKVSPKTYIGTETGLVGLFYEEVAISLTRLYKLFNECNEYSNAKLAAKWSFDYALRSNADFQLLCETHGNMITIHLNNHEFSECLKLEQLATELCHRKRGQLDDAEMRALCILYSSVFFFYVEYGKKTESLEFGLPVMHMVNKLSDLRMRVRLVVWVLNLLLSDLRIAEMVILLREPLYLNDQCDLSATTWYYFYSMVVLIETGYCVESYHQCERFYMNNGDSIIRSKTKDPAWDYFACMWLVTVRVGAWERSVLWEAKVEEIISLKKKQTEYNLYLRLILLEGLLILLVREIDYSNTKKIKSLTKAVKNMFQTMRKCCERAPIYRPRYYLLLAYFHYIRDDKIRAHSFLEKTLVLARDLAEGTLLIWAEHTRQHWAGTLSPAFEDYWAEHIEPDKLLDYRDFSADKLIIPYTLPLPKIRGEPV